MSLVTDRRAPRKLLMVANYFPPMASGGNARQLRFIRYLPEFGWEPVVLSARCRGPVPDPPGVRIVRAAAPSPEPLYALGRSLPRLGTEARRLSRSGGAGTRDGEPPGAGPGGGDERGQVRWPFHFSRRGLIEDWLFVPDPYVGWIVPGVLRGRRLLREERFDAIFSSYPRGSTQLIASRLAHDSGLPWLVDYRDPWPTHQFRRFPTPLHRWAHFSLERLALRHADEATACNEPIADDLRRRYPALAPRVHVLSNGYDPNDDIAPVELPPTSFWLVHTGRLFSRAQIVRRLLDAMAALPGDVGLLFVGVTTPFLRSYAAELGILDRVRVEPFVPHAVARGYQRAADALLVITGEAPESLSSKIFEYLAAGRPIVAITPPDSAAARLLAD
ncbi:MAG TPA: glycosyltransferase, partial [Thermoleophilia bacterium]|nr:glycosyltransferase [Thermoleophilia bacterium]